MILFAHPIIAGAGSVAAGAAAVYYATYAVRSQWLGPADWHGRTDTASVALTFDDGPSEDTERILEVLDRYGVQATFFMLGRQIELFPEIARRVFSSGHEIGNHSYSHSLCLLQKPSETRAQFQRAHEMITNTTGARPRFARPPYGVRTPAYFAAARRMGLRTVQWSIAGFDWKQRTGAEIAQRILRGAKPGSIILLHDGDGSGKRGRSATVAALPMIIEGLQARGLRIVPLSQLLGPERPRRFSIRIGLRKTKVKPKLPVVFLDFDGTITCRDAVDAILEAFADPRWLVIEEEWKSGRIGSRECLAAQMQLVRATKDEIDALLDSIEVDLGLVRLLETCAAHGVERILGRSSLDLERHLRGVKILSSHMEPDAGHWRVDFPSFHQSCGHGCATCKPAMMSLLNRGGRPAIFIGDGLSDKYAAASADLVFAKDGLAAYCRTQQIQHLEYNNLADVAERLDQLLRSRVLIRREVIEEVSA
jgi:peptidoglycan/xylan/chitin deacetylase (PgdA/CDA1 family)/2-hydroxy-3-keto-5-methylthiopentenyl-1-phosphate phosphatase